MKKLTSILITLLFAFNVEGQVGKTLDWNPYKLIDGMSDTVYKDYSNGSDSFLIQYVHSGSFYSPAVARMICDIDSSRKDTVNYIDASTGKEGQYISFARTNCREDTDAYIRERHFYSHIQVYRIKNGIKSKIGKEIFGFYVESGCFEDMPQNWVTQAKNSLTKNNKKLK